MSDSRLAYWLRGNDQRLENRRLGLYDVFRATFFYALLYEPAIVVSDSDTINGQCFRHAIKNDEVFRQLAIDGYLRVACREHNHRRASLSDTLGSFIAANKRPRHFSQEAYEDAKPLESLESKIPSGLYLKYPLKDVSHHFTEGVLNLLKNDSSRRRFGDELVDFVLQKTVERIADDDLRKGPSDTTRGTIGLNYLYYEHDDQGNPGLGAALNKKFGRDAWREEPRPNELVQAIRQIGLAAYLTGLPTVTDSNPLYSDDQKPAIELWRARTDSDYSAIHETTLSSTLDISTFVAGVKEMNVDRLRKLRATDEWEEYKEFLDRGATTDAEVGDLHRAFKAYRLNVEAHICDWLCTTPNRPQQGATMQTSLEKVKNRLPWVRHKIIEFGKGKIPHYDKFKLIFDMFQPSGQLRASNVEHKGILDKLDRIDKQRHVLTQAEEAEPAGRLKSELVVTGGERRRVEVSADLRDVCF